MNSRDKTGSTRKQQLESVWRQTGVKPAELEDELECPESCWHIWKIFIDLHNTRPNNGFGSSAISNQEVLAYCILHKVELDDWELILLRRFDDVVLELQAKQREAEERKQEAKQRAGR